MKAQKLNPPSPLNLVILGGGYAGLMALITLRNLSPQARITLIDPRPYHLVITRLHETVHRPLESIQIPFAHLAKRFDFIHKQYELEFDQALLSIWDQEKCLQVGDETIAFNYLLIATGALSVQTDNPPSVYDLNTLTKNCFAKVLQQLIAKPDLEQPVINIVGAGPTGIQFAFEIAHVLLMCHKNFRLNLIDSAGDCSHYDEMGSNLMTSQSALRKGRAVAKNILLKAGVLRFCLPYMHQDIGYLLSLGPSDAIGWIGSKNTLVSGLPAFMAKEAIEAQYDWLLSGFDSYVI
jgi:NADH dehydrogenase FAD-containing subunit